MIYRFNDYELDQTQFELRHAGTPIHIEPQVFELLLLLVQNPGRMLSKDEIVQTIWGGDAVSDASIASRIRFARQAIGDDGKSQHSIKTQHGRGFRFVATVSTQTAQIKDAANIPALEPAVQTPRPDNQQTEPRGQPSIAVLPFEFLGERGVYGAIADAIPHELIQALSRLRWLMVIARGSAFQFRDRGADVREIGRQLDVGYCLTGSIEITGASASITVELADSQTARVIWGDQFRATFAELPDLRSEIVAQVVSSLEVFIPANEASQAALQVPANLGAWSNYHLGLQNMFRFSKIGNAKAKILFERAVHADPQFARAHAGLSFTEFIDAFVRFSDDPGTARHLARQHAERALELDAYDPFANLTMGRTFWLEGNLEKSMTWLDRAITLCPNYAQAFYSRGFADMVCGVTAPARTSTDKSIRLSPLDPLLYGMLGTQALTHIMDDNYAEAAVWADKAALAPGAHFLISMIAVAAHSLNDDTEAAESWLQDVRSQRPDAALNHFFDAFPFTNEATRTLLTDALARYGIHELD